LEFAILLALAGIAFPQQNLQIGQLSLRIPGDIYPLDCSFGGRRSGL
jgi:hypothetical protein